MANPLTGLDSESIDEQYILTSIEDQIKENREGTSLIGSNRTDFLMVFIEKILGLTDEDIPNVEEEIEKTYIALYDDFRHKLMNLYTEIGVEISTEDEHFSFENLYNIYQVLILFFHENAIQSFKGYSDYTDGQVVKQNVFIEKCNEYFEDEEFGSELFFENLILKCPDDYCVSCLNDLYTLLILSFNEEKFQEYCVDFISSTYITTVN